jgi:UDP-N-acetyl-D-glucosamine dehydrogenase
MKVSIIGQGYVGLTIAEGAASAGYKVVGYDIDRLLISNLTQGQTHVPGLNSDNLKYLISINLYTPTSSTEQLYDSDIYILAVPTPLGNNRLPDLRALGSAAELVSTIVKKGCLVINESTSHPGTLRNFIRPLIDPKGDLEVLFAVAPERVDPGNSIWGLKNTPRVISGLNGVAIDRAIEFYSKICDSIYRAPSAEIAEASKLFENTFRHVNIALVNEFSLIADKIGFSAHEAIRAASTKPFGYMPFYPSIGVGGHCIPIDPIYLTEASKNVGEKTPLIDTATKINLLMTSKVVERIQEYLKKDLKGLKIQIAGISYKNDVSDMRESPAVSLIQQLEKLGALVSWHDPVVKSFQNKSSEAINPVIDLGLIVTPHKQIDFSTWKNYGTNVLDLSANSSNYGWPKFL